MQGEINSLYHYCKFLTFIEKILPNNQLKLGLLKFTNDPRESKNIVFSKTTFYDGPFIKNEVLTDFVRDKCKVLCFLEINPLILVMSIQECGHYMETTIKAFV